MPYIAKNVRIIKLVRSTQQRLHGKHIAHRKVNIVSQGHIATRSVISLLRKQNPKQGGKT